jgi:adenosine deaminase
MAAELAATADWFDRLPKVELHLHLEGAIPLDALWALVRKYGGDAEVADPAALERRFRFRDFSHFIDTWVWKNGFLRELDDFAFIAEAVARDLAAQRVRYAEVFFSPPDFLRHGLRPAPLTAAIRRGLDRAPQIEVALIGDLVRDFGPQRAERCLAELAEASELGVIGVGLGGSEQSHPPEPFAAVFAEARRRGLHTTAHAGEAAGAASVWGALRALQVERIGHGTRAEEDPDLVRHLVERRVPLELCPISNVRTAVVPTLEAHPIGRYQQAGVVVTVNTDDPKMFGTSLADEYRALALRLGFSRAEIRALVEQAATASWLPEERRRSLLDELRGDPAWDEEGPESPPG